MKLYDGFSLAIDSTVLPPARDKEAKNCLAASQETWVRMVSSSDTALKTFSSTNDIKDIPEQDEIYKFDVEANKRLNRERVSSHGQMNELLSPSVLASDWTLTSPLLQV